MNSELFSQNENQKDYKTVLLTEITKHPKSQVQDIYKFIHQASFGSEHAVKDTAAVRKWMEMEVANLNYSVNDQLIDTLFPKGNLARINLRPYLKKGFDSEKLLRAFVSTANNYTGSDSTFNSFWKACVELAKPGKFVFDVDSLNKYFRKMSDKGFPAVHHSKEYANVYQPAYRVVDLNYLPILFNKKPK
jgi:transcription elongation factor GreA-like protein